MSERHDDVVDLVERAEKARTGRRTKVTQEWGGDFAAHVTDGAQLHKALLDEAARKSSRWSFGATAHGENWVSVRGFYVAKGANANDAEKLVRRLAAGEVYEVAVNTIVTRVIGD